jgi:hypothetical protein
VTAARAAALAGLCAAFAATVWVHPWNDLSVTDIYVLQFDAKSFVNGLLPYRDVLFEYPPLAAPVVALPALAGTDPSSYSLGIGIMTLACFAALLLLVGELVRRLGGREWPALWGVALSPLMLGAVLRTHFDVVPVALTVLALLLIVRGRGIWGLTVLGLAVAVKGYPIVVAPVAFAWLWVAGRRRELLRGGAAFAAIGIAAVVVAAAISPSGANDALRWQTGRPIQVESTPAAVLYATGADTLQTNTFRSNGLSHPWGRLLGSSFIVLGGAIVLALAWGAARAGDGRSLVIAALAATVAYASFGKVLSPQYLVWTVPLMAVALAWRRYALATTLAAATILTLCEFPSRYRALVRGETLPIVIVCVRDVLLVAAVGLAVAAVARPRPAVPA